MVRRWFRPKSNISSKLFFLLIFIHLASYTTTTTKVTPVNLGHTFSLLFFSYIPVSLFFQHSNYIDLPKFMIYLSLTIQIIRYLLFCTSRSWFENFFHLINPFSNTKSMWVLDFFLLSIHVCLFFFLLDNCNLDCWVETFHVYIFVEYGS